MFSLRHFLGSIFELCMERFVIILELRQHNGYQMTFFTASSSLEMMERLSYFDTALRLRDKITAT